MSDKRRRASHKGGQESVMLYVYIGSGPRAFEIKEEIVRIAKEKNQSPSRWMADVLKREVGI